MSTYFYEPNNWSLGRSPRNGDDLVFDGAVSNVDCTSMGAPVMDNKGGHTPPGGLEGDGDGDGEGVPWTYDSIRLVGGYAGHVEVVDPLGFATVELTSGHLDQMAAADEVSVFQSLNWTHGTFNSTTNLSKLILEPGCTGEVAADASVSTGSHIVLAPAALAGIAKLTFEPGTTVEFCNAAGMEVGDKGKVVVATTPGKDDFTVTPGLDDVTEKGTIVIKDKGEIKVEGGGNWKSKLPLHIKGGDLIIIGLNDNGQLKETMAKFEGNIGTPTDPVSVQMDSGRIAMTRGAKLAADNSVKLSGGNLTTLYLSAFNSIAGRTTIDTPLLQLVGARVTYFDGLEGPRIVTVGNENVVPFDEIYVTQNVYWAAGSIEPFLQAVTQPAGITFAPWSRRPSARGGSDRGRRSDAGRVL